MKCPKCQAENLADSRFCHQCASPLHESTAKTIKSPTFEISRGDLFAGRYEIIEELGQGGMGKVFKVYDHKISEVIALKLIRPEIGVNTKAVERFKNELKCTRKIAHRNICRMYDLGSEEFFHYITMEYVPGEDLKRFIRRAGSLTTGKAIYIAKQVAEGLAEAHRLNVVHRDLKPQNIMIDQDGNAKIMDFGIARFADTERMTGSGVMIGTPEYMSPEQAELMEVDKRADIYSLGVVLYEMVSGRVPFEGETPLSIAMKHKTETPRNVREINAQVSPGLAAIISRCMEKSPANRYQSAEELIESVDRVEKDLSTAERVVPKKAPLSAKGITVTLRSKKLIVPAAAFVILVLAGLAVLKFLPRKDGAPSPAQATETQGKEVSPDKGSLSLSASQGAKKDKIGDKGSAVAVKKEEQKASLAKPKSSPADADLNSANLSRVRMNSAKNIANKDGVDRNSLFYRLAEAKAQEAQKYLSRKSLTDAKCLFFVSEKLYRVCTERKKDEDRLNSLKKFVDGLKKEIEKNRPAAERDKLYGQALNHEKQAAAFRAKKDLENSAKSYVQASVCYEKLLLTSEADKNQ
jgi:serine/threonine protein kinase